MRQKIRDTFSSVKNDYLIIISYFLVLIAGYFIGITSSSFPNILNITKDVMGILLPICGLFLALLGLNNWKAAERLKMVCKFANEIRTSSRFEQENLLNIYSDFRFLIELEQISNQQGESEKAQGLQKTIINRCGKIDECIRLLIVKYQEHSDELYVLDKKIKQSFETITRLSYPYYRIKIDVNDKYGTRENYIKRIERTQELFNLNNEIRERLIILSAANF